MYPDLDQDAPMTNVKGLLLFLCFQQKYGDRIKQGGQLAFSSKVELRKTNSLVIYYQYVCDISFLCLPFVTYSQFVVQISTRSFNDLPW